MTETNAPAPNPARVTTNGQSRWQYSHRMNGFVKEITHTMEPHALVVSQADKPDRIVPYGEITGLRLMFAPTRVQRNRFLTTLETSKQGKLHLLNETYKGLVNFEDQSAAYSAFVTELIRRVATSNASFKIQTGTTWLKYWGYWAICLFIAAGLVFIAAALFVTDLRWLIIVKIFFIVVYLPTLVRFMKRARPGHHAPDQIPPSALPASANVPGT